MVDYPTDRGKEEAIRRYIEGRQRANAYLTSLVYALVFWCLLGVLYCVLEMFLRRQRRREREMRMYLLHQRLHEA